MICSISHEAVAQLPYVALFSFIDGRQDYVETRDNACESFDVFDELDHGSVLDGHV